MPPLAKFSAAPFGIVERFAEKDTPPLLSVTLRNVEADLKIRGVNATQINSLKIKGDTEIIRWFKLVHRLHETSYSKATLDRILAGIDASHAPSGGNNNYIETRSVSLLKKRKKRQAACAAQAGQR